MRCVSCVNRAYYYCTGCTTVPTNPVPCCGIRTGRNCFSKHVRGVYNEMDDDAEQQARTPIVNTPRRRRRSPRSQS